MAGETWQEAYRNMRKTPELREVYARFGHSGALEEKLREMSQFLRKENFIVDIPDHPAFVQTVKRIVADKEALERWRSQDPSQREGPEPPNHLLAINDQMWKKVVDLHESKAATVEYLSSNMGASLPIEIEYSLRLVEIRPKDVELYRSQLYRLEQTLLGVEKSGYEAYRVYQNTLDHIKWIKEGLEEAPINIFKLSENLIGILACNFWESGEGDKALLDAQLFDLAYAEYAISPGSQEFTDTVLPEIRKYIDAPGVHNPWLTHRYIWFLTRHEVALRYPPPVDWLFGIAVPIGIMAVLFAFLPKWVGFVYLTFILFRWSVAFWTRFRSRPLLHVLAEVVTGTYSGPELARRLRALEGRDVMVSSLLLGLLDQAPA